MSNPENIVNFVTTIAKIAHIVNTANELYKKLPESNRRLNKELHESNRRLNKKLHGSNSRKNKRPVNFTHQAEVFFEIDAKQLKEYDENFFKSTTMNAASFSLLLSRLRKGMMRWSKGKAVAPERRLAITLMFLAEGCNFRVISQAYNLGHTTIRKIIYETCDAIWEELHFDYLSPPNVSELKDIAEKFYAKTGMPNCMGAINAKHIHISRPKDGGSLYYNFRKSFSVAIMAVCDADYVFRHVDVGAEGSRSDGILARSAFGRKLLDGTLEVPRDTNLPGTSTSFPYYYVGDSSYPLKPNLMRPFPGRNLPADKEKYNRAFSKAREHIENAYGILANRWRVLQTTIHASPNNTEKIVLATILLHNFLMLQNDTDYFTLELVDHTVGNQEINGRWREDANFLKTFQLGICNRSSTHSFQLREKLKEFISSNAV
ncbi:protein ALP1-like [Bactrocera tryoni]|uniref:protein ALP1-like n=1 Tax=Bactrocera tryoni TaxID=59916 RepID=UPI001A997C36|nr:protein ALP1-like [Bactrocera tryoni]